jgi:hypothetical protein
MGAVIQAVPVSLAGHARSGFVLAAAAMPYDANDDPRALEQAERAYDAAPWVAVLAKAGRKAEAVALLRESLEGRLPPDARTGARKLPEQLAK